MFMSQVFWQAKIWGLLHDPLLKSLYKSKNQEGIWEEVLKKLGNPNPSALKQQVKEADFIAAASDRPSWDQDNQHGHVDYNHTQGLQVSHLLSGHPQSVVINGRTAVGNQQDKELKGKEAEIIRSQLFPLLDGLSSEEQHQKAFWWLWRCLPVALAKEFGDNTALLPADTRIPDCSVWSHNSSVSALAGSLIGLEDNQKSRPYLVIFTMTPIQEMIKASRKMQDFWAGSWLLHYLSAKICWKWAEKYGPDALVYPSLYAQPLIDHWLRKRWSDFDQWIDRPSSKQLLTAGFPNVLVAVLPEQVVCNAKGNALASAEGILRETWLELGNKVWEKLPRKTNVDKERLWDDWLKHQWQTYWTAVPLGNISPNLDGADALTHGQGAILTADEKANSIKIQQTEVFKKKFLGWVNAQNKFCQLQNLDIIYNEAIDSLTMAWNSSAFDGKKTCPTLAELTTYRQFNVGLWWAYIYDQLRHNLASVKNARSWQLPSAFSPRSTISGIGPVLHPQQRDCEGKSVDWVAESVTREFWKKERGWFDGIEELNATEILKRGLKRVLPQVLDMEEKEITSAYPDLTVGVAGLLHQLELCNDEKGIQKGSSGSVVETVLDDTFCFSCIR
jgi:CRISPR-associated protein Cmr2